MERLKEPVRRENRGDVVRALGEGRNVHAEVRDDSSAAEITLRNVLAHHYMSGVKRILEVVELALANDRQYIIARKQILDIAGDKERELKVIVKRILNPEEKEDGNGS